VNVSSPDVKIRLAKAPDRGSEVGIFIRYSLHWRHYHVTGRAGIEVFDLGHEPALGWRTIPPAGA
jgi:hypothetical protein